MAKNRVTKSTSSKVTGRTSKVLRDSGYNTKTNSFAGSVLSQSARTASHSTRSVAERILKRHDKAFNELSKK